MTQPLTRAVTTCCDDVPAFVPAADLWCNERTPLTALACRAEGAWCNGARAVVSAGEEFDLQPRLKLVGTPHEFQLCGGVAGGRGRW